MPYVSPAKGPKTKRLAHDRLLRLLHEAACEEDMALLEEVRREVPDAWHLIEMDLDVIAPKDKITLYLDRAVVKCFRAMGHGYHARINRILETWMQMKMAELKALEMQLVDALSVTQADCTAPDPEDWETVKLEKVAESWAYRQGYEAGQKAGA